MSDVGTNAAARGALRAIALFAREAADSTDRNLLLALDAIAVTARAVVESAGSDTALSGAAEANRTAS